ncbi:MAG: N-acetyl-gamma-glutamyl-phosphate reductase [Clostridia bacterium]|nr:N-acetyl-gamma-glutamyl-phosphate reductase [Clostridia bacterium]
MFKVFIDGREGTTGLRITERIGSREEIALLVLSEENRKDPAARREMINESDITFLCLPDDAARESVSLCDNPDTVIIDASTAHRTVDGWAYGFPELSAQHRQNIAKGKRIAVPGCHASGFVSLVYPLVAAGILPTDYPLSCFSVTGYSGGGKKMIAQYEAEGETSLISPRQYATGQNHKHLKEMKHITGIDCLPVFSPIVSSFYSGMEVTVPIHMSLLGNVKPCDIADAFADRYKNSRFVRFVGYSEENEFLASDKLSGRDCMEISVYGNSDRIILVSRFDNLGKGASGAAVQCMNIALGLSEETGLVL